MSGRLVLVRHGQSLANVDKRLDTRPPGAELTPLGREQARAFAQAATSQPGLLLHSVATRAVQTAAEISAVVDVPAREVTGIHEVQVGDLEGRNDDDAAIAQFNAVYERWLEGRAGRVDAGRRENADQVLDRYLPVLTELRTRYLDEDDWIGDIVVVSHGAAIRLSAAVLADASERSFRARPSPSANTEAVVLTAGSRRALGLRAVGNPDAAVLSGAGRCRRGGVKLRSDGADPERVASDRATAPPKPSAVASPVHSQPTASQSTTNVCGRNSGPAQSSSVHSERCSQWRMSVPWQCSRPAVRHSRQFHRRQS